MVERTELRSQRLLLRPFRFEDLEDVLAYATDEEFGRYLGDLPQPYTRRDGEEFLANCMLASWESYATFAIVLDARAVGGVNLRVDQGNRIAELGYSIACEHWGKGLVPEAAHVVVDWGFETYTLSKVYARADARNDRSLRVMEKLGMKREGLLRSHYLIRGERCDEIMCGLLREEWEAMRMNNG